jgi:hypothetical protein
MSEHGTGARSSMATCPKCWKKVKPENLRKHLKKVHGITRSDTTVATHHRPPVKFPLGKFAIVIAIAIVCILIIVFAIPELTKPGTEPVFSIDRTTHDFGIIGVEIVSTNFTITNDGDGDLWLYNISTSCDCTTATLYYKGQPSPTFKMTGNPDYKFRVHASDTVRLQVTMDSSYFSQSGPLYRLVYMSTNADGHENVELTLTANVQR